MSNYHINSGMIGRSDLERQEANADANSVELRQLLDFAREASDDELAAELEELECLRDRKLVTQSVLRFPITMLKGLASKLPKPSPPALEIPTWRIAVANSIMIAGFAFGFGMYVSSTVDWEGGYFAERRAALAAVTEELKRSESAIASGDRRLARLNSQLAEMRSVLAVYESMSSRKVVATSERSNSRSSRGNDAATGVSGPANSAVEELASTIEGVTWTFEPSSKFRFSSYGSSVGGTYVLSDPGQYDQVGQTDADLIFVDVGRLWSEIDRHRFQQSDVIPEGYRVMFDTYDGSGCDDLLSGMACPRSRYFFDVWPSLNSFEEGVKVSPSHVFPALLSGRSEFFIDDAFSLRAGVRVTYSYGEDLDLDVEDQSSEVGSDNSEDNDGLVYEGDNLGMDEDSDNPKRP